MNAFHSFWSLPNSRRNFGEISFPDFELLTAMLSVFTWQKHSGEIKMITDTEGASYFERIGLEGLWNGMDICLDHIDEEFDPIFFWAAGKLEALKRMDMPCVMLDTDLILWEAPKLQEDASVVAAHEEALADWIYPDPKTFRFRNEYEFPKNWNFEKKAANTAFLYMKDPSFRNTYIREAQTFFRNVETEGLNPVTAMCFGEQRILPMCAAAEGVKLDYLMREDDITKQDYITHTWGLKQTLRSSWKVREAFCMRAVKRIMTDFPEKEELLAGCSPLKAYYEKYLKEI